MNPEVELDDLKDAWLALEERLDHQDALSLELLKERRVRSVTKRLRPLAFGQVVQTLLAVALIIWSAMFWVEHRSTLHLMITGIIMQAYGIAMVMSGGITLSLIGKIDYAVPVTAIDDAFSRLRRWYVRSGMVLGLAWWFLWMPFMTMVFMSLFGVDMFSGSPSVIWMGALIGLVGLAATWVFHRWAYHPDRPRIAQKMADSTAGKSIVRSQTIIDELSRGHDQPGD